MARNFEKGGSITLNVHFYVTMPTFVPFMALATSDRVSGYLQCMQCIIIKQRHSSELEHGS